MRRAWAVMAAIGLAAMAESAQADVFVPADPPASAATCVTAGGDLVIAARPLLGPRWAIEASQAGGAWQRVARVTGLERCPMLASAPDGTAALATGRRVRVRRPGGSFGAPMRTGGVEAEHIAAAAGGWVGVIGVRRSVRTSTVVATIVAPDGTSRSAVLDRGRVTARSDPDFQSPRIGIDARGAATAAWTRWSAGRFAHVTRTARTIGTPAWQPPQTLGPSADATSDPELGTVAVAVAPGGRTLIAWADSAGMRASLDGGHAVVVTSDPLAGSLTAAVADDGSAVVAHTASRSRLFAVDRGPGSDWSSPHLLTPDRAATDESETLAASLTSMIAPDGRAVVTWRGGATLDWRVMAASGRLQGSWTPATPLSAITRDAGPPALWLGPAGDPQVVWLEHVRLEPSLRVLNRLRGARLAPATALDRTAPELATRLPARTRRTRTGRVTFRVPVRCSESCDVRLRLIDARIGYETAATVRELPASRQARIRLRVPDHFVGDLLSSRRARRPRLEVLVTDRAGNVARRSRRVTVRVIDRPLIAFQVPLDHDFLMFSRAGNRAMARFVNELIAGLARREIRGCRQLTRRYRQGVRAIGRAHPGDDIDTAVLEEVFVAVEVPFRRVGCNPEAVMG